MDLQTIISQKVAQKIDSANKNKGKFSDYPIPLQEPLHDFDAATQLLMYYLSTGKIDFDQWKEGMQNALTKSMTGAFAIGAGVTIEDLVSEPEKMREVSQNLSPLLALQLGFLEGFAGVVLAGLASGLDKSELPWKRWSQRAGQYVTSIVTPYWQGIASENDLLLPAYPGDGSAFCGQNDRCRWRIVELDREAGDFDCFWELGIAEHCQVCLERHESWYPYKIRAWMPVNPTVGISQGRSPYEWAPGKVRLMEKLDKLAIKSIVLKQLKGGPGSGNYGHRGIPGHQGGSQSGGIDLYSLGRGTTHQQQIPEDILNTPLYHGSSNEEAAKAIIESGEVIPPKTTGKGMLSPAEGRVYATQDPDYAFIYGLGGNMSSDSNSPYGGTGYIFELDTSTLYNIQPDEDQVGELALDKKKSPDWLTCRMKAVMTEKQLWNYEHRYGWGDETANQAAIGKKIVGILSDHEKFELVRNLGNVANLGPVKIKRAWKIDRTKTHPRKPFYSQKIETPEEKAAREKQLFSMFEEIPLPEYKGGPGSGNFAHHGIPGHQGGSQASGASFSKGGVSAEASKVAEDYARADQRAFDIRGDSSFGGRYVLEASHIKKDLEKYEGSYINVWHATKDEFSEAIQREGIKTSDHKWFGREPGVYFFANEEDAKKLGAIWIPEEHMLPRNVTHGDFAVIQFRIPVDEFEESINDGKANYDFETSTARYIEKSHLSSGYITPDMIEDVRYYSCTVRKRITDEYGKRITHTSYEERVATIKTDPNGPNPSWKRKKKEASQTGYMVVWFTPKVNEKGGAGSGNFGHHGRPGVQGGSQAGGISKDEGAGYLDTIEKGAGTFHVWDNLDKYLAWYKGKVPGWTVLEPLGLILDTGQKGEGAEHVESIYAFGLHYDRIDEDMGVPEGTFKSMGNTLIKEEMIEGHVSPASIPEALQDKLIRVRLIMGGMSLSTKGLDKKSLGHIKTQMDKGFIPVYDKQGKPYPVEWNSYSNWAENSHKHNYINGITTVDILSARGIMEDPTGYVLKGGKGSGNFGHRGRPGIQGGSAEGGVSSFRAQEGTPEFKAWFGSSKVVNEDGTPKVLYHGTPHAGFEAFDPNITEDPQLAFGQGVYLTESPEAASGYANPGASWGNAEGELTGSAVYPVYAKIEKPFNLDAQIPLSEAEKILDSNDEWIVEASAEKRAALSGEIDRPDWYEDLDNYQSQIDGLTAELQSKNPTSENIHPEEYDFGEADEDYKKDVISDIEYDLRSLNGSMDRIQKMIDREIESVKANYKEPTFKGSDLFKHAWENTDTYHDYKLESQLFGGETEFMPYKTEIIERLKEIGYDGFTHIDHYLPGGKGSHRVWIAFDPNQVKSATGNKGAFNPEDVALAKEVTEKGGRGSGFWNHHGRSGLQGGSSPSTTGAVNVDITKTPEFKKWFGRSKVVDASGRPMVVYHATTGDFDTFDTNKAGTVSDSGWYGKGFYFGGKDYNVSGYVQDLAPRNADPAMVENGAVFRTGSKIYPVFLRMERPLRLLNSPKIPESLKKQLTPDDWFKMTGIKPDNYAKSSGKEREFLDYLIDREKKSPSLSKWFTESIGSGRFAEGSERVTKMLKAAGFDGVIIGVNTEFLVFEPNQIKSIANQGRFSLESNSILKEKLKEYIFESIKGGKGSGNFGHSGRPGIQGGSARGGVNLQVMRDPTEPEGIFRASNYNELMDTYDRPVTAYWIEDDGDLLGYYKDIEHSSFHTRIIAALVLNDPKKMGATPEEVSSSQFVMDHDVLENVRVEMVGFRQGMIKVRTTYPHTADIIIPQLTMPWLRKVKKYIDEGKIPVREQYSLGVEAPDAKSMLNIFTYEQLMNAHGFTFQKEDPEFPAFDLKGGPGSGNFGHAGRLGIQGGSQAGGVSKYSRPHYISEVKNVSVWYYSESNKKLLTAGATISHEKLANSSGIGFSDLAPRGLFGIYNGKPIIIIYRGYPEGADPEYDKVFNNRVDRLPKLARAVAKNVGYESDEDPQIAISDDAGFTFSTDLSSIYKGGPGSGNFGHAGRPGEQGGSLIDTPRLVANAALGQRAADFIKETYGVPKDEDHASFIAPNGDLIGDGVDHQGTAVATLTHLGVPFNGEYDALKKLIDSGVVRLSIQMDSFFTVDGPKELTQGQKMRIWHLKKKFLTPDTEFTAELGHETYWNYHDYENAVTKGGPGSGNFGHVGRPGEQGGSSNSVITHAISGRGGIPFPAEEMISNAVKAFGVTENPKEAGYMLPDARMLDFSGRSHDNSYQLVGDYYKTKRGAPDYMNDKRLVDHREVGYDDEGNLVVWKKEPVEEGYGRGSGDQTMGMFMRQTKAIRMSWDRDALYLNMFRPPNERQAALIKILAKRRKYFNIDAEFYEEATKETHFSSIEADGLSDKSIEGALSQIDEYYHGGWREKELLLEKTKQLLEEKIKGRGNWEHKGRPGQRGGSQPSFKEHNEIKRGRGNWGHKGRPGKRGGAGS